MKTISVHGIDGETEKAIKARAKSEAKSINKVVKEIIAKSLGLGGHQSAADKRAEFADLSGVWTEEEADQFLSSIGELEIVDPGDWK